MPVFIGYDQAERMVAALLDRAEAWQPEAVVAIVRGGLVPGTMAAGMLALPLAMIGWERATAEVAWIGPAAGEKRILLVDDCCSSGATLRTVRDWLLARGHDCATLTIVHDPETTSYVPDFSHPMRALFRLPWERGEATPAARRSRALTAAPNRATERAFVGLELDGVLLPDMPRFAPDRAVVITGRPDSDRVNTAAWLAQRGHGGLPLECRPASVPADIAAVARYKAESATRWGCMHFVEGDPEQAIRIAAHAPHLLVSWWSADETRAWLIGAASAPPV